MNRLSTLAIALALAGAARPAAAQHAGHDMGAMPGMTMPAAKAAPAKKKPAATTQRQPTAAPAARPTTKPTGRHANAPAPASSTSMPGMDHAHMTMDHAAMAHGVTTKPTPAKPAAHGVHKARTGAGKTTASNGSRRSTAHAAMHQGKSAATKHSPASRPSTKAPMPMDHGQMDMSGMDHGDMDMSAMHYEAASQTQQETPNAAVPPADTDHAGMDMTGMDHSTMDMSSTPHGAAPQSPSGMSGMNHAGMDHGATDHSIMDMGSMSHDDPAMAGMHVPGDLPANAAPRTPIAALTDADRAAAFPPLATGHPAHDRRAHAFWLMDRLEVADESRWGGWEGVAWIGGDVQRAWLRTEGDVEAGRVGQANVELLYGRSVTPWWDVVAGVRQDVGEGPSRTWAAIGVQGLAPYKFEVEATAYLGQGGRTAATVEAEYDTLITNRLVLQWRGEASLYDRSDEARMIGAGLSNVEAGARLRYEITRRLAPYVGVEIDRAFGGTSALRRAHGLDATDTRIVAGLRFWF